MKKILIQLFVLMLIPKIYAQEPPEWQHAGPNIFNNYSYYTGNVGIGTDNPQTKLHLFDPNVAILLLENLTSQFANSIVFRSLDGDALLSSKPGLNGYFDFQIAGNSKLKILGNGSVGIGTDYPDLDQGLTVVRGLELQSKTSADKRLFLGYNGQSDYSYISSYDMVGGWKNLIINAGGGNVGIGTATPDVNYKLSVNGKIRAKEIRVETGWSDFVFGNDYKLMTLEELDKYIKENKHLPDIPTESEVKENGVELGDMSSKLLQKIEELTLYLIEQKDEIEKLKVENDKMKDDIKKLR